MRRALDDDQRARGDRLRAAEDRRAHVVAHAMCREVLGGLLGLAPAAVRFVRDAHGKPAVQGGGRELFFSLSHTRGLVACAASFDGPLGIDVEAIDAAQADAELLDLFVQAPAPEGMPGDATAAFYACWTAVEAYWKARGTGLSTANPRLRLARQGDGLQATLENDASEASRLFVTPIDAAPGFAVALACRRVPTLRVVHWGPWAPERAQKCDKSTFVSRSEEFLAALS
jgi:4'-phosphopantetheinyl transferase